MSTHGGDSFPGLNTLFGRVHRVSRSLVPSFRWFRSFVPSFRWFRSFVPSFLSFVPYLQIHHNMKGNIQTLQNNALRCCLNIMDPRDANVIAIHRQVNVLLFKERLILNLLLCIRNAVIESTLKTIRGDINTRQNDGLTIQLPIPRTKIMRKMPFYWGSQIWNTLPLNIRQLNEKCAFKMYIKTAVINNTLRLNFNP